MVFAHRFCFRFPPLLAVFLLMAAGCAVPDAGPTFRRGVGRLAAERTGAAVRWARTPEEQAQTDAAVRALLSKKRILTADAAVRIALLHNRALQAEFEEVGVRQAEFVQAGLLKNPEFAGSARFITGSVAGVTDVETALAADVLDWLLVPLRRRLAGEQLWQTELRVADEAVRLAAEVKRAFYTLQARQQLLVSLRAIAGTNEATMEFTRQLRDAGNVPDLDLANQQATLSQSRLDVAQTEAGIATDREALNRLLGLADGAEPGWRVADRLPGLPAREASLARLESVAVTRRLDLEAARVGLDVAGRTLRLREGTRFFPAGIRVGVDSERDPDRRRVTGPTLQLELPIFDQGQAQVARLQAQFRQAQRQLEERVITIRADVRGARARVQANRRLAEYAAGTLLPQRRRVVELTQQQYNAMLRGAPDLFLARQNTIAAERSAAEALRDYWIARADLERAVGGRLPVPSGGKSGSQP